MAALAIPNLLPFPASQLHSHLSRPGFLSQSTNNILGGESTVGWVWGVEGCTLRIFSTVPCLCPVAANNIYLPVMTARHCQKFTGAETSPVQKLCLRPNPLLFYEHTLPRGRQHYFMRDSFLTLREKSGEARQDRQNSRMGPKSPVNWYA